MHVYFAGSQERCANCIYLTAFRCVRAHSVLSLLTRPQVPAQRWHNKRGERIEAGPGATRVCGNKASSCIAKTAG